MKKLLLLALAVFLNCYNVSAESSQNVVTKNELGELIREYLVNNPEVIIESMTAYQTKQQEAGTKAARDAINANKDSIYHKKTDPFVGDKNASVIIVEFFDYNCSACKYMFKSLDALVKEGLKDTKIVFKEFPIFGETSQKLAKIGLALYAVAPDKYYDFHAKMMAHKGTSDVETAYAYAKEVGVSQQKLEAELSSGNYATLQEEAASLGETLQIRGTPFLIIGEEPVPHAIDETELREFVEKAHGAARK